MAGLSLTAPGFEALANLVFVALGVAAALVKVIASSEMIELTVTANDFSCFFITISLLRSTLSDN
jgi:hypothetical protein